MLPIVFLISAITLTGVYIVKGQNQPELKYFKPSEFGAWYPFMDKKLLLGLDELRRRWGSPIEISGASGALGREGAEHAKSQHFFKDGLVRAADIMPTKNGGALTDKDLTDLYYIARDIGVFSGIGLYPDWKPRKGLHLDTRTTRTPENPATWAGVKTANGQVYISINDVLVA